MKLIKTKIPGPLLIKSNIKNGLGIWGGYAVANYQLIINQ